MVRLWEDTLATSTFDIKGQNTQRSHFGPFTNRLVCDEIKIADFGLNLTVRLADVVVDKLDQTIRLHGNPYLAVNHESQQILEVVKSLNFAIIPPHSLPVRIAALDSRSDSVYKLGVGYGDLQVWLRLVALESVDVFSHGESNRVNRGLVHAKQLDSSPSAVQCALLGLDRLEAKAVTLRDEVDYGWSIPCLIFFGTVSFSVRQVLAELFEDF
ncbi:hypothetical protein HG531_004081 [Fusarium graminearum]|nr:hypothetical protein HG531_004081 [Fusarium graminearum]